MTTAISVTEANLTTSASVAIGNSALSVVDIIVIAVYFVGTLGVGLWATWTSARKSVKGYFLAGKNMVWWPVGASVFASNIGAGHFIGLAGTGAVSGIAVAAFEWLAVYLIIMLGWIYVPIYVSCNVYTMPEYLKKRYGGQRLRVSTSIISMIMYVLTKIAVDLYAGALFIQLIIGINLYLAIVSLLTIAAIYTILGGLRAVIYTDTMQTVIMVVGGIIVTILAFNRIDGYGELEEKYMNALPATAIKAMESGNETVCGLPRSDAFRMLRHPVDGDIPWLGIMMAMFMMGSWYWCTDQVIVQRTLAANTIQDAKGGCILAGILKITPMYIMVLTGMVSRVLFPDEVACAVPEECERICQNPEGCSNIAYPLLVLEILPSGLRGLMVAAMLSALMSSLTSVFNSTSTIFTLDIWKRIRKTASEREQLIVGKVTILCLVVISILWIPILSVSSGGQLFIYINIVISAIGPSVFAIFFYGIMWTRANEKGAFWGMIAGFVGGAIRLVLEFMYKAPACGEPEERPPILYKVNYLYVSAIIFGSTSIVIIIVSLLTKPPKQKYLHGTTWFTIRRYNQNEQESIGASCSDPTAGRHKSEESDQEKDTEEVVLNQPENAQADNYHLSDLYEDPKWARILDAGAICVMILMAFLIGYYA